MSFARRRVPLLISLGIIVFLALRLWSAFDSFPEVVATHYDAAGRPDGYSRRESFVTMALGFSVGCFLLLTSLPVLFSKAQPNSMNVPHRDYWLVPERIGEVRARMCVYLDWFTCGTVALLVATFELGVRANMARSPMNGFALWTLLFSYVVFAVAWTTALWRSFRLPAAPSTS